MCFIKGKIPYYAQTISIPMTKTTTDIQQLASGKQKHNPSNDHIILNSGEAVPIDVEDKFAAPATSDSIEFQPELSCQTIMTAPSATMMVNAEGKITLWSIPAAEIFGYSSSDTIGQMFYSIITLPKFYEASKRAFNTFIQTAERQLTGITLELPAHSQNGREFYVEMSWTALEIQGEKHVLASIKDISDRKQWEKQQRQLQEAQLVNEVLALVTEHKDLPSILSGICRCMAAFYQVPKSAFALLDAQQTQAEVIAEYCTPALPSSIGQIVPVTHNPSMTYLLQHKAPLAIKDAQHDPRGIAPVKHCFDFINPYSHRGSRGGNNGV